MLRGDVRSARRRTDLAANRAHDDDVRRQPLVIPQKRQAVAAHAEARVHVHIHDVVIQLVVRLVRRAHEVEHACDVQQAVERPVVFGHVVDGSLAHGGIVHVARHEMKRSGTAFELFVLDELLHSLLVDVEDDQVGALAIQLADRRRAHAAGAAYDQDGSSFVRAHDALLNTISVPRWLPANRSARWSRAFQAVPCPRRRYRTRCSYPRCSRKSSAGRCPRECRACE